MKRLSSILVVMVLCIGMFSNIINAESIKQEDEVLSSVDGVLVSVDGRIVVKTTLSNYRMAKKYGVNDLYKYLTSGKTYIDVIGVTSNEKYIDIKEYRTKLKFNNPTKSISEAIKKSSTILEEIITGYQQVVIDDKGNFVKNPDGTIKLEPIILEPSDPTPTVFKVLSIK